MLVGRSVEQSRLTRVVADAKDGHCRSLVIRGEAGIGKTALLDYATDIAGGLRILRVVGVESEAEIPFAGLQLMFGRFAERFTALPGPQGQALAAAFGTMSGSGDRLLVGAAIVTLLSDLAEEQPLLCLVDDVHWFDQSSIDALLFAIRRLHTDPVAMIFAARDGDRPFPAAGVDSITLPRLDNTDSARLLASVRAVPHDVAERVLAESGGNPLAILELATSDEKTAPVAPLPAAGRLAEHFRLLVGALPDRTRLALLLAAADHGAELRSFTAAAARQGLAAADLEPAEQARLVRVSADAVEFRHPLIRAAAYQDAPFAKRVAAHEALAAALSEPRDADRRAWHLAAAATGTDDTAAAELEQAAARAVGRGGPAAAAAALARAAQLSGDPTVRARCLVGAARAAYDAGQLDHAAELAEAGGAVSADPGERAEAAWIRAQVAYERSSPGQACVLALDAAAPILTSDPQRAVSVLTEATWCARDAADPALLRRCAEQLKSVGPATMADALTGLTDHLLGNGKAAIAPMRALLVAEQGRRVDATVERLTAGFVGLLAGADEAAHDVLDRLATDLRGAGALGWLPYAHEPLALAQLVTGRFRDAEANVAEAAEIAADLGQHLEVVVLTSISAWLAAVRGDNTTSQSQAAVVLGDARNHGMATALANWAHALSDLMAGNPAAALDRLEQACTGPAGADVTMRAIPDHVEAGVRAGELDRARRHLPTLTDWAAATASPVAQALVARCEALLGDADCFEKALRIEGCGPYDQARTRLAYGEWLRRNRRRTAARTQLVAAGETFERIGAHGWLPRVRAELTALGDPVAETRSPAGGVDLLTPQELQVVRRAAAGLSNREIAAELFLSPRTVGHHLYKAYPKLGVGRRAQLAKLGL